MTTNPSYEDVTQAFARIRREGGIWWDIDHPLRDFVLASQYAAITRDAERLAAYRQRGQAAPLGYYDATIDHLYLAIEMLRRQRAIDHGDAPVCLQGARSKAMRAAIAERARKEVR